MKHFILKAILILLTLNATAQVGIGTTTPAVTLDVVGEAAKSTTLDGVLTPRLTGEQLRSKTYTLAQTGALVYVTTPDTSPAGQTINVTNVGHYYFDGTLWLLMSQKTANTYGDIKSGIQTADHNGWILLNGRSLTDFTTTQQAVASSLGLSDSLPNASNAYLSQNGNVLGNVSGSNDKNILQNQLPNVTLTGNTNTDGEHSHSLAVRYWRSNGAADIGAPGRGTDFDGNTTVTHQTNAQGAHSHTVTTSSINGGVTQQSFNISPRTLSVNNFIYLGN